MARVAQTLFLNIAVTVLSAQAVTQVPAAINFQGRLTRPDGRPLAGGTVNLNVRLFAQLSGGSPVYDSGTVAVPLRQGVFSLALGQPPTAPLNPNVLATGVAYVEANNKAWALIERPELTDAQVERCLALAWSSLYHWLEAGAEIHWARARDTVSRAALVAGDLETALTYAQAYKDALGCQGAESWDGPFALAAKARALAGLGMEDEATATRAVAKQAAQLIDDPEERDLGFGPWFGLA